MTASGSGLPDLGFQRPLRASTQAFDPLGSSPSAAPDTALVVSQARQVAGVSDLMTSSPCDPG